MARSRDAASRRTGLGSFRHAPGQVRFERDCSFGRTDRWPEPPGAASISLTAEVATSRWVCDEVEARMTLLNSLALCEADS